MPTLRELIDHFDIDASRVTPAGWLVSVASVGTGLFAAVAAYLAAAGRIQVNEGPALAFGVAMIAGTVLVFVSLRAILTRFGVQLVKDRDEGASL